MKSLYLDHTIERAERAMRTYDAHRNDMLAGAISGDVAIEKSCTLAVMIFGMLDDIGFYIRCGYTPSEPLPDDIRIELTSRNLIA